MRITLVTVTYGRRWHFLRQVLEAARQQGIAQCVVVDNGAQDAIAQLVAEHFGPWASTVCMGRNSGSAPAFRKGIEQALAAGADSVLLLDDDNIPLPGCIDRLIEVHEQAAQAYGNFPLAVMGFRRESWSGTVDRILHGRKQRIKSSFRGFHLFDLPTKIFSRLRAAAGSAPAAVSPSPPASTILPIQWAVYGGLLFHRSLIETIGLPNADFVLYEDDTDFSFRISLAGGKIFLVLDAVIVDAELSWNTEDKQSAAPRFLGWLKGASDLRVFYTFRNGTFWDRHTRGGKGPMFWINLVSYMAMLAVGSVILGRYGRFRLLIRALRNGLSKKLGEDPEFKLL